MDTEHQYTQTPHSPATQRRTFEYGTLTKEVQLGSARRLGIVRDMAIKSFDDVLLHKTPDEVQEIITAVGARFDDDLISFVVGSIINQQYHEVVIRAEETEGVNGHLLWETPLLDRVTALQQQGHLKEVAVRIERFSNPYAPVTELALLEPIELESAA